MIIRGNVKWAKLDPKNPGWGYKNAHKEWSFDFSLDEATEKKLLAEGMSKDYIKNKGDDRGNFLSFKRRELKRDGTPSKPFEVKDKYGNDWDHSKKIGNGSVMDVKIVLNEVDGQKGLKPSAIKMKVHELVEFGDDFEYESGGGSSDEENWD